MLRTGLSLAPQKRLRHLASTTGLSPDAGGQLPGAPTPPRTGLTPASRYRLTYNYILTTSFLRRPYYRTHVKIFRDLRAVFLDNIHARPPTPKARK